MQYFLYFKLVYFNCVDQMIINRIKASDSSLYRFAIGIYIKSFEDNSLKFTTKVMYLEFVKSQKPFVTQQIERKQLSEDSILSYRGAKTRYLN